MVRVSGSWRQMASPHCERMIVAGVGDADACAERERKSGWEASGVTSC